MVAQPKSTYYTPQQYLAWEENQEERHEYHDGVIVAMSGGTRDHSIIAGNLGLSLGNQLRRGPCEVHSGGLKVHIRSRNRYFYPDVAVLCGSPSYPEGRRDTIDNPVLVIEVLSESTEHFDRTTKMDCYGTLESMRTCLLVSQREPRIERYYKVPGQNRWDLIIYTGIDTVVPLPEIECDLKASEVYERIEFAPESVNEPGDTDLAQ